jgi:ABC-2 type transport system ATP-binding protein
MSDVIISVKSLYKTFRKYERGSGFLEALKSIFLRKYVDVKAVDGVSFDVKKGEILGYLGPNGAGKSTVIKMLTGILYPTSGSIRILGLDPWMKREEYVKNIGVVFGQKRSLWWDLPAMDSFNLQKAIYDIPDSVFKRRLNELMELLAVKDIAKTPVRNLSLGEQMRCEFIAAMLHNPKILFLDEPTIGLDVVAKENVRTFIKKINREFDTTVILTTHDVGDVEELCNRIIIIDKGSHVYEGTLRELRKKYVDHKILKVEFDDKIREPVRLRDCTTISQDDYTATLRIDSTKISAKRAVTTLFEKYDVADIDVEEQSVESIIRKIYDEAAKRFTR